MNIVLSAYRLYLNTAFLISSELGAHLAFKVFATPRKSMQRIGEKEASILRQAKRSTIHFENKKVSLYHWGKSTRKALLVHGWEGHAGNFGAIVPILLEKGYEVIAFDGPAHQNSQGKMTNILEFSRLVTQLLKENTAIELIVGHSMGSGASLIALHDHQFAHVKKLVLMSTPNRIEDIISNFSRFMRISKENTAKMFAFAEQKLSRKVSDLNLSEMTNTIRETEILLIHDKKDRILPYTNAIQIKEKNPTIQLISPENTGHYKMLWHQDVLMPFVEFLEK